MSIEQPGFSRRTAVNLTFACGGFLSLVVCIVLAFQLRSLATEVGERVRSPAATRPQMAKFRKTCAFPFKYE